jgi:hypothetical protein
MIKKTYRSNFWKLNNLAELIGVIAGFAAIVSIWFAIASLNMSKESLDLTKESIDLAKIALLKSDQQDSINRVKDSLFYISDTTFKGKTIRLQNKQQKLIDSLINLTNNDIEEKRYTDRPIVEFRFHSIKVMPFIIHNSFEHALDISFSCKNKGIRETDSLTIVQYAITPDYKEIKKTIFGPFHTLMTGESVGCCSSPIVGLNKLQKMKSVIVYLEATWYDKIANRKYSTTYVNSYKLHKDGIIQGYSLNDNELNRVLELINN